MTRKITVANELNDWWGGTGIPIAWKVSETVNEQWDANSRPDHAPPDGLQGLVQEPFSSPYTVPLEVNIRYFKKYMRSYFVLTPPFTMEGQNAPVRRKASLCRCTVARKWSKGSANSGMAILSWAVLRSPRLGASNWPPPPPFHSETS
jgi:hypothetical protein